MIYPDCPQNCKKLPDISDSWRWRWRSCALLGDLGAIISVLALALLDSLRREVLLVLGLRSLILDSWD